MSFPEFLTFTSDARRSSSSEPLSVDTPVSIPLLSSRLKFSFCSSPLESDFSMFRYFLLAGPALIFRGALSCGRNELNLFGLAVIIKNISFNACQWKYTLPFVFVAFPCHQIHFLYYLPQGHPYCFHFLPWLKSCLHGCFHSLLLVFHWLDFVL